MFEQITVLLKAIDNFVWGIPIITLILATGIFLTIRLRGLQITKLPKALKFMVLNEEGELVMLLVLVHFALHSLQQLALEISLA